MNQFPSGNTDRIATACGRWLCALLLAGSMQAALAVPIVDSNGPGSPYSGVVSIQLASAVAGNAASSFCSGVLTGARTVLTAAHCAPPGAAASLAVTFNSDASGPTHVAVAQSQVNPNFDPSTFFGDFQLLTLSEAAPASAAIYSLAGDPLQLGQQIFLAGYGGSATQKTIREGVVDATDGASWLSNISGVTDGDSGGPMFIADNGQLLLAGNTSFTQSTNGGSVADVVGGTLFANALDFLQAASVDALRVVFAGGDSGGDPGGDPGPDPDTRPAVDMPSAFTLIGPNDPNCDETCPGAVTYSDLFAAPSDGNLLFDWAYATEDVSTEFDPAGLFIGVAPVLLIDPEQFDLLSQSGSVRRRLAAGQRYQFFVESVDNGFGAATLQITNARFVARNAGTGTTAVNEPGTLALFGIVCAVALRRRQRNQRA